MRYLIILLFILFSSFDTFCQCIPHEDLEFQVEIIARSSGNDLDEPFIAGEEVFVSISYDSRIDTNGRIVHGLIPTFGPGWNIDKIDVEAFNPVFGHYPSSWVSIHDDCPPYTKQNIPSLCTYVDVNGNLQLCNLECELCPCSEGLKIDELLPSGWFWNFQSSSCSYTGDCLLPMSWGPWGTYAAFTSSIITLDILLTVSNYSDVDSCDERKDLTIGLQEIYDDVTGCYPAYEDYVTEKLFTESWSIDCSQPPTNNTFNKLKFIIYHDKNLDGVKDDNEVLISYFTNFGLEGDSISGYSELWQYYLLTGNDYKAVCDTNNFPLDYALSTQSIIDVNFNDGVQEKEVEFGVYRKPTSVDNEIRNKEVIAYPNPVTSKLMIELPQGKHLIKLINNQGLIIYQNEVHSNTHSIDTNEFATGLYYLNIYNELGSLLDLQKIIKY
jgi:hypothetical protein